jgi:low affinity Fe/Cu permease
MDARRGVRERRRGDRLGPEERLTTTTTQHPRSNGSAERRHPNDPQTPATAHAEPPEKLGDRFNRYSSRITEALGSFSALALSVVAVIVWAITGPLFNFSDTWQLFINTTTTVITFWMVFVIQNSSNRDAKALHLKLDEIIRATEGARNTLISLESAPEAVVARTAKELAVAAEDEEGADVAVAVSGKSGTKTALASTRKRAGARRSSRNGSDGSKGNGKASPSG